jgi:hypothetical protein
MADPITLALVAGTALNAAGSIAGGAAADSAAKAEAMQMESNADQAYATGTRRSYQAGKDGEAFASDVVAAQVAAGGTSNDPQALRQRAKADAATEYNVLAELYQGKVNRQDLKRQAYTRRIEGKNAQRQGFMQGAGTALGGMASFT